MQFMHTVCRLVHANKSEIYSSFRHFRARHFAYNLFALKLACKVFSETNLVPMAVQNKKQINGSVHALANHNETNARNIRTDKTKTSQRPSKKT